LLPELQVRCQISERHRQPLSGRIDRRDDLFFLADIGMQESTVNRYAMRPISLIVHRAVHPPSMGSDEPLMNDPAEAHKYVASSATSSGSIRRLIDGSVSMTFWSTSSSPIPWIRACSDIWFSTNGVRT